MRGAGERPEEGASALDALLACRRRDVADRMCMRCHMESLRRARTVCAHRGLPSQEAEDIAQDVCVVALERRRRLPRDPGARAAWILRAADFRARAALRRREKRERLLQAHADQFRKVSDPGPSDDALESTRLLEQLARSLTDAECVAVALARRGMPFGEVSRTLGISVQAARRRLERAIEHMRESQPICLVAHPAPHDTP